MRSTRPSAQRRPLDRRDDQVERSCAQLRIQGEPENAERRQGSGFDGHEGEPALEAEGIQKNQNQRARGR